MSGSYELQLLERGKNVLGPLQGGKNTFHGEIIRLS